MENANSSQNNTPRDKGCIRCEYLSPQDPTQTPDDGLIPTNILEWSPENYQKTKTDPENYKVSAIPTTYSRGTIVIGSMTGQNVYSQIKLFSKAFPGLQGPNYVDTRDNKIVIHNGKNNALPKFAYTYAGGTGELLELTIATKYTQTITSGKQTSIDPDDKSVNTEIDQCIPTEEESSCQYDRLSRNWGNENELTNQTDALFLTPATPRLNRVRSKCIKAKSKPTTTYNSEEEAKEHLSNNAILTQDEIAQFNKAMQKKYKALINPQNEEDMAVLLHESGNLEDLIIKRKALVYVDPVKYSTMSPTENGGDAAHWKSGYKALKNNKEISVVYGEKPYQSGNNWGKKGDRVLVEMTVEVPIPGVRVMSSPNFISSGQTMINDVIKSTNNQVKANAKFVGNPSMESSQNMEIHNISDRYSGIWYSKEVTHTLDSNGYFTEVEFNKKTQNILTNRISAKVNTQEIFKETQKISEESYRTGAWKYSSQIEAVVKKYREDSWKLTGKPASSDGRQIWAEQDKDYPNKWTIYESETDLETGRPMKQFIEEVNL